MGLLELSCPLVGIGKNQKVHSNVSDVRYAWVVSGEETADPDGLGPLNVEEDLPVKFADRYVSDVS